MGVVFKDVVAACEIVNCNAVEVQCQGLVPTISVDNTVGCQIYLNKDSLQASLTTAKSSEVNVIVPASEADGDWMKEKKSHLRREVEKELEAKKSQLRREVEKELEAGIHMVKAPLAFQTKSLTYCTKDQGQGVPTKQ